MNNCFPLIRRYVATLSIGAVAITSIGCMRGMTYKVPMPASMTIGTVKEDQAALASASNRPNQRTHPIITSQANGQLSNR